MKALRSIIRSFDLWIALSISVSVYFILPPLVSNTFAKDVYGVGISVLAIVFAVYFAALATIISASDNDFIRFLEAGGHYTLIVQAFQWTLLWLFVALAYSIITYVLTASLTSQGIDEQQSWAFVCFCFLFSYGLLAAYLATRDAIEYSRFRAKFVRQGKKTH